jgi:hypothetical protein
MMMILVKYLMIVLSLNKSSKVETSDIYKDTKKFRNTKIFDQTMRYNDTQRFTETENFEQPMILEGDKKITFAKKSEKRDWYDLIFYVVQIPSGVLTHRNSNSMLP